MSTNPLLLAGLDGANPLGFLTAVGALVSLVEAGETSARLSWQREASWKPVLTGLRDADPQKLCDALAEELRGRAVDPKANSARIVAEREFKQIKTTWKKATDAFKKRGLKGKARSEAYTIEIAPIAEERDNAHSRLLEKLSNAVPRPELAIGLKITDMTGQKFREWSKGFLDSDDPVATSSLSLLAAFGVEGDSVERITRTYFDFVDSAARLAFIKAVHELMSHATPERLEATLFRPWLRQDERWSLRFDPVEDRRYALLDRDPTAAGNKSRSQWMANLLAYRALSLFPCAATRRGPATTSWCRIEEEPVFTWPLWKFPVSCDTLRSLLGQSHFASEKIDADALRALGIVAAYRSRRVANGDYINFSPARACI